MEFIITVIAFCLSTILNFVIIKIYGLMGAVAVQFIVSFVSLLLIHIYNLRNFDISIQYFKIFGTLGMFTIFTLLNNELNWFSIDTLYSVLLFPFLYLIFYTIFYRHEILYVFKSILKLLRKNALV